MFVYSLKGSTVKLGAVILAAVILLTVIIAVFASGSGSDTASFVYPEGSIPNIAFKTQKEFSNIKTAADRVSFLQSYGWDVEDEPYEVAQVVVPKEFDAVYTRYNELQRGEGLDLSKYKGKTARRYTYVIKNYDHKGTVFANILVYKDRVIAGDVCSADVSGFIHGLTRENNIITDGI